MTVETTASELVELASKITGEGEVLDLSDRDFTIEELALMRAHLSHQRRAIDMVNKALAVYWDDVHFDEVYYEEHIKWSVKTTKGKRIIHTDTFYAWLATKDADGLARLVSASAIKVGGMTPAERDTLLDETPTNADLSIKSNRRY